MSAYRLKNTPGCVRCSRSGVYFRMYSGERLCRACFNSSVIHKVRRTISRFKMLKYRDKIAIGVSGGKDSLSLLHIMKKLCGPYSSQLYAVTVDEGINGYRKESLELASMFSSQLDIPHRIISFKDLYGYSLDELLKKRGRRRISSCAICGLLRRRAIDIVSKELAVDVVATAHNLDDILQTFLLNLFGGDLKRMGWMNPTQKNEFAARRIRPFMEIYEREIAFYAYLNRFPFQQANCPYRNESMRSEFRWFLNFLESVHAGIKYTASNTALDLCQSIDISNKVVMECEHCSYPSSNSICSVCNTLKSVESSFLGYKT